MASSHLLVIITVTIMILTVTLTQSKSQNNIIIKGNTTLSSDNHTFSLGFFTTNQPNHYYLGIWYSSLPTPTYVWVANRAIPTQNLLTSSLAITDTGQLSVLDGPVSVWKSEGVKTKLYNVSTGFTARLLETGNLVVFSPDGFPVWESFDYPTDTWLPGMNITGDRRLVSWRSEVDPAPGLYSMRLKPYGYNEFELVYNSSDDAYWSTGNWTGTSFTNVPEMTIPYIYMFHFMNPAEPSASFWYTEMASDVDSTLPLTRFQVDVNGQLKQFTWSVQGSNWNMFWSQPEDKCKVYALCGNLGFCTNSLIKPCVCFHGYSPAKENEWDSDDYSSGCRRTSADLCQSSDRFVDVGAVGFDASDSLSFSGSRTACEKSCLDNCSCIGLYHNDKANFCKVLYGSGLNLRHLTAYSINQDVLYLRVPKEQSRGTLPKPTSNTLLLVSVIVATISIFLIVSVALLLLRKRVKKRKGLEEDGIFPVLNLKVFTYKELHTATNGFSEKLGHGGFGTVFKGWLPDSTVIAVKRLEKPGGGEKEFRAEVCTIGNIQHVNLVRLRGFCSENSHRLLVYDYMQNGPLSVYLRGGEGPNLSWDVRFQIAISTAKGISYLHEECRDCIIHCDIKPENILLDSDFSAKVSDFGLAKLLGRDFSRVLATMRGTWGYVAPEWISGVAITAKADVYSYGMTLLELIGGRRNVERPPSAANIGVEEDGNGEKWFFPPWASRKIIEGNLSEIIDQRLAGAFDADEAERVALVAIWCIQDNEEMRPTMGMVVKMLEGMVEIGIPPAPKLLQALVSGESYHGVGTGGGCSGDDVTDMDLSRGGSHSSGNISPHWE